MQEFNLKTHERIRKLVFVMLKTEPFFARVALGVKWAQDDNLKTLMVTDGSTITYNPRIIELSDEAIFYFVAIATIKVAMRHAFRSQAHKMKNKEKELMASDASAGAMMVKILNLDHGGRGNRSMRMFRDTISCPDGLVEHGIQGKSFEQLYDLINNKNFDEKPKPNVGVGLQQPGEGDRSDSRSLTGGKDDEGDGAAGMEESDVKGMVNRALMAAKQQGHKAGDLIEQFIEEIDCQKDYTREIVKFLGGGELPVPDWSKPSRRYIGDGVYLPGNPKEGPGTVVLVADTSGSVDEVLLNNYIANIRKINEDLQPEKIYVIACDAAVQWTAEYTTFDEIKIVPKGRGGTAFKPAFDWVRDNNIKPNALVYFTDLECNRNFSFFGSDPGYPVLWVVWPGGDKQPVPFGQRVEM